MKYQTLATGEPFPAEVRVEYRQEAGGSIVESKATHISSPVACAHAGEEFYLPYYGISESSVPALNPPTSHFRTFALLVGVTGAVIALWLLIAFKRPAARGAQETEKPDVQSQDGAL